MKKTLSIVMAFVLTITMLLPQVFMMTSAASESSCEGEEHSIYNFAENALMQNGTYCLTPYGRQIRFQRNDDGSYAGMFDIRAVATMSGEDFDAIFGTRDRAEQMIKSFGFVFGISYVASPMSLEIVKNIVEHDEHASYDGYVKIECNKILTKLVPDSYSFTCLVTGIPDSQTSIGFTAVAFMEIDTDLDGIGDTYLYYDTVQNFQFSELYAKGWPIACEKYGW